MPIDKMKNPFKSRPKSMPKLKKLFIAKIIITAITYASRNFVF